MDKIVDHLLVFEGEGKIKDFIGSFTEYRDQLSQNKNTKKSEQEEILEKLNNETDYNIISELSQQLEETTSQLEAHEMRWLELQEILE